MHQRQADVFTEAVGFKGKLSWREFSSWINCRNHLEQAPLPTNLSSQSILPLTAPFSLFPFSITHWHESTHFSHGNKWEERTTDLLPADRATRILSGAHRMEKKDSKSHGISSSRKRRSRRYPGDILKLTQDQQQQREESRPGKCSRGYKHKGYKLLLYPQHMVE